MPEMAVIIETSTCLILPRFGRNSHKKLWAIVNVRNSGKISLLISFSFSRPSLNLLFFAFQTAFPQACAHILLAFGPFFFTIRVYLLDTLGHNRPPTGAHVAPPTQNGSNKNGCPKIDDVTTERLHGNFSLSLLVKVMQELKEYPASTIHIYVSVPVGVSWMCVSVWAAILREWKAS